MNPERKFRREALLDFSREEINRLRSGEINHLSTPDELGLLFSYRGFASVYNILRSEGLVEQRRLARVEFGTRISPSYNLAWMIGLLSEEGTVQRSSGAISIPTFNPRLIAQFQNVGEELFQSDMARIDIRTDKKGRQYELARFYDRPSARFLGDLRKDHWSDTVAIKHSWIMSNPEYIWGFIRAVFETSMYLQYGKGLVYSTNYPNNINFMAELFQRVNIARPRLLMSQTESGGISGLGVLNLRDLKFFAEYVHSVCPEKEEKLNYYRNLSLVEAKLPTPYTRVLSEGQLVEQYLLVREFSLKQRGKLPTIPFIENLREKGIIEHSATTFSYHFGEGKFSVARVNLERIIEDQER